MLRASVALLGLVGACVLHDVEGEPEAFTLRTLAAAFPGASRVIEQAGQAAPGREPDGYRLSNRTMIPESRGRWRVTSAGIELRVRDVDPGSYELQVVGQPGRVGVRCVGTQQAELRATARAVHIRGSVGSNVAGAVPLAPESFLFATSSGIEELLVLRDASEPVTYELTLPRGWRVRRAKSSMAAVEIVNGARVPQMRMIAPRAWDAAGEELAPEMAVDGRFVTLSVPAGHGDRLEAPLLIDPEWQDARQPAVEHLAGTITLLPSGQVLIVGGFDVLNVTPTDQGELYDPLSGVFELVGSLEAARFQHTATCLLDGSVLVAGGGATVGTFHGEVVESNERWNPDTRRFESAARMFVQRYTHTATRLVDGRVLIAGGSAPADEPARAELYDPSLDEFRLTGWLQQKRFWHTATLLPDGNVLIAGGAHNESTTTKVQLVSLGSAELYDPASGLFEPSGALVQSRSSHAAILVSQKNQVVVAGGAHGLSGGVGPVLASAERYNLSTGTFETMSAEMPTAGGPGAAVAMLPNGTVLLAGPGSLDFPYPEGGTTAADIYDPELEVFGEAGPMPVNGGYGAAVTLSSGQVLFLMRGHAMLYDAREPALEQPAMAMHAPRVSHTATLLTTGKVLLVGGSDDAAAELYDPTTRQSAPLEAPSELRRFGHSATRLTTDDVLIAGGVKLDGGAFEPAQGTSDAHLFHPQSGEFRRISDMALSRSFHAATLLADGRVLLTGGDAYDASFEVFDPQDESFTVRGKLQVVRFTPGARLLLDGRVIIVGGRGIGTSSSTTRTIEYVDPRDWTVSSADQPMPQLCYSGASVTLSDGRVLLGDLLGIVALDPASGVSVRQADEAPTCAAHFAELKPLPDGQVLTSGCSSPAHPSAAGGCWDPTSPSLPFVSLQGEFPSCSHSASLLPDGAMLLAGGDATKCDSAATAMGLGPDGTDTALLWRRLAVPTSAQGPRVDEVRPARVTPGDSAEIVGHGLAGGGVAANGGAWQSSDSQPTVVWIPLEGPPVHGTLLDWSDTRASWRVPATSHPGPGLLFVVAAGVPSGGQQVIIERAPAGAPCPGDGACACPSGEPGCGRGYCVDGFCCDSPCQGGCEACSAEHKGGGEDGVCGPVPAGNDPKDACQWEDPVTCGSTGTCDGAGECKQHANGTECLPGLACYEGQCRPSYCDGGHVVLRLASVEDCTPYRCSTETHVCLTDCNSNLDCVDGYLCTPDGECVEWLGDDAPGCAPACALGGGPRRRGPMSLCVWLMMVLLGRRSRRRKSCSTGSSCLEHTGDRRPRARGRNGERVANRTGFSSIGHWTRLAAGRLGSAGLGRLLG